ncbi:hypothetical protein ASG00_13995 [Microbacterium sp. Leaf351]|nr:hypothetical protein ASG00_13995 [Microbacterium sp. Leaf351]
MGFVDDEEIEQLGVWKFCFLHVFWADRVRKCHHNVDLLQASPVDAASRHFFHNGPWARTIERTHV